MADRIDEIGAVQRVEVELLDALIDEVHDLLGRDGGGDQMRRRRVVLEPFEAARQPGRDARARLGAKPATCLKLWIGTMPGMIGTQMPAARARSRKRR